MARNPEVDNPAFSIVWDRCAAFSRAGHTRSEVLVVFSDEIAILKAMTMTKQQPQHAYIYPTQSN